MDDLIQGGYFEDCNYADMQTVIDLSHNHHGPTIPDPFFEVQTK
jgi:hypothetical protein